MIRTKMMKTCVFSISFLLFPLILTSCGGPKTGATGSTEGATNLPTGGIPGYTDQNGNYISGGGSSGIPMGPNTGTASIADLQNPATMSALSDMMGGDGAQNLLNSLNALDGSTTMGQVSGNLGNALALLASLVAQADKGSQDQFNALIQMIAYELNQLRKNPTADNIKKFAKRHKGKMCGLAKHAADQHNQQKSGN